MNVSTLLKLTTQVGLTKLLTMILLSPFPVAGPVGTVALAFILVGLVVFLTPPTGAAVVKPVGLPVAGAR